MNKFTEIGSVGDVTTATRLQPVRSIKNIAQQVGASKSTMQRILMKVSRVHAIQFNWLGNWSQLTMDKSKGSSLIEYFAFLVGKILEWFTRNKVIINVTEVWFFGLKTNWIYFYENKAVPAQTVNGVRYCEMITNFFLITNFRACADRPSAL